MISKDQPLCRWHLKELSAHCYTDNAAVDIVNKFYGSIIEVLQSEEPLTSSHVVNMIKFIIRFGTSSQFKAAVVRLPLPDLLRFQKNAPDMKERFAYWRLGMESWDPTDPDSKKEVDYWSILCLRILLAHPGAVECLKGFNVMRLSSAALERMKAFPEYQNVSEEAKSILQEFAEIKSK